MTTETGHTTQTPDAELVAQSLAGSRDAFRQIVERHQTLVCSLAYCATGSVSQSEDVAQETFLAAWKQLPEMREPSKLRSWLCAIARFVIGKELRRRSRQPLHRAETLEVIGKIPAIDPLPSDRVVSKEEETILWDCVGRIPEVYREALVLFYREHQSVKGAAEALGLSEDAVKQRLARGRKLLHKQVLAYVEGALENTKPTKTFSGAVMAALPLSAFSAKILAVGAAAKTSTLKTLMAVAAVGVVILYWSFLGFLVFAGGCAGYWMKRSCARSLGQCQNITRFWRILARTLAGCVIVREALQPVFLTTFGWIRHVVPEDLFPWWYRGHAWFMSRLVLDLALAVIIGALGELAWRSLPELAGQASQTQESLVVLKSRLRRWVLLGLIVPALWFIPTVGDFVEQKIQPLIQLSHNQLRKIVSTRKDASYRVIEDDNKARTKTLQVDLPENYPPSRKWVQNVTPDWWKSWTRGARPSWWNLWMGDSVPHCVIWTMYWAGWRPVQMTAPADEWTLRLLDDSGTRPKFGKRNMTWADTWPFWRWMYFILPMGIMVLLRRNGAQSPESAGPYSEQLTREGQTGGTVSPHGDPRARRLFWLVFGSVFTLAFTVNAFTAFGLYVLLLVGALKGAFVGLVAAIGVLYLRSKRKVRLKSD